MTQLAASKARWAIEVERADGKSEFYSVRRFAADEHKFKLYVADGSVEEFARDDLRKILIMRTKDLSPSS